MVATTLDGKATAAAIRAGLTERVASLAAAGRRPGLGTLRANVVLAAEQAVGAEALTA